MNCIVLVITPLKAASSIGIGAALCAQVPYYSGTCNRCCCACNDEADVCEDAATELLDDWEYYNPGRRDLSTAPKRNGGVAMTPLQPGVPRGRVCDETECAVVAAPQYSPPTVSPTVQRLPTVTRVAAYCVTCGSKLEPPGLQMCAACGASVLTAVPIGAIN